MRYKIQNISGILFWCMFENKHSSCFCPHRTFFLKCLHRTYWRKGALFGYVIAGLKQKHEWKPCTNHGACGFSGFHCPEILPSSTGTTKNNNNKSQPLTVPSPQFLAAKRVGLTELGNLCIQSCLRGLSHAKYDKRRGSSRDGPPILHVRYVTNPPQLIHRSELESWISSLFFFGNMEDGGLKMVSCKFMQMMKIVCWLLIFLLFQSPVDAFLFARTWTPWIFITLCGFSYTVFCHMVYNKFKT